MIRWRKKTKNNRDTEEEETVKRREREGQRRGEDE
jgi:hypothetical protein